MQPVLTLAAARSAADAAFTHAARLGLRVSVAVVDSEGHDVLVTRADRALWFTTDVARAKARSAVAFRRDSGALAELKDAYPELLVLIEDQLPFRVTTLPGGLPLRGDETVLGAVGVSGGDPDQDTMCAQAAADAVTSAHAEGSGPRRE